MATEIAKLIESLVFGLMSEILSHTKDSLWRKIKLYRFNKSLSSWIRSFINSHDGSALTSGDFEVFLTYQKPLDKIADAIVGDNPLNTSDAIIEEIVAQFKTRHSKRNNITCFDEMILKDLFCGIYQRIDLFYRKQLSDSERYMIAQLKKTQGEIIASQEKNGTEIKHDILKIKELLQEGPQIKQEDIRWIYEEVSKLLIEGNADAVNLLVPLLNTNASDLVYAVPYLLGLMSDYDVGAKSFTEIQTCIKDDDIYSDIVRKTIYYSLITGQKQYWDQVSRRNANLKSIAENLVLENYDVFYKEQMHENNGINTINLEVQNNYPSERWLVLRICAMALLNKPVKNASSAMTELLGSDRSITDIILYFERKSVEIQSTNYDDTEAAEKLYREIMDIQIKVSRLPADIQNKYYAALLRTSVLISSEKGREAVGCVPSKLQNNEEIEMLCMQVSILTGDADEEKIVSICVKNNQYWLFNNYLIQFEKTPVRMKEIIENHRFIISKDVNVFLIYIQTIAITEGKSKAKELLESYEERFSGYLEYWVEKIRLCSHEESREILEYIYGKKDLYSCSPQSKVIFIRMLYDFEYYEEALHEIENEKVYSSLVGDLIYIRSMILLKTKREIEAWDSFGTLFASGRRDPEVIFYLLVLANRNHRDVDDSVLQAAADSSNPKVLLCLSNYYELHQKCELAEKILLRSMFYSGEDLNEVFGNFLRLHSTFGSGKSPELEISDINSAVYLESLDGLKKKVFCIHHSRILPQEPFDWGDATHIYKDSAIRRGLYRKKSGDIVVVDDESFRITEILTLDCYLFRFSMQRTVDAGKAKYIYMSGDDSKKGIEELKKELLQNIDEPGSEPQWLTMYKDLSEFPVTVFFAEQFVRVNYVHLTLGLLRDNDIIMRELPQKYLPANGRYILSFTSIIALHEIGFIPDECSAELVISNSSLNEIEIKTEQMISENSREHVASMGIQDGQLYFIESSEEAKQAIMQRAVSIKAFARKFDTAENDKDLQLADDSQFDCKDFLGICDYDTIAIAKEYNLTLVAFEAAISAFSGFSGIEVDTIGIADFLSIACDDPNRLVEYIQKMFELRFMFPLTCAMLEKLITLYSGLPELEQQNLILKWEDALKIPACDEKYRAIIAEHARSIFVQTYETIDTSNPIWKLFAKYTLRYLGMKIQIYFSPDGKFGVEVVPSDE